MQIKPHGGKLVSRITDTAPKDLQEIKVSVGAMNDVENIADGIYSPLEGFVGQQDLESIMKNGRLTDGTAWTIPILLDVPEQTGSTAKDAGSVLLCEDGGQGRAIMHVTESYALDAKVLSESVYGTSDPNHPGVAKTASMNTTLLGGNIELVSRPSDGPLRRRRMTPIQTRQAFEAAGWKQIVAFQTRNPPHVAHEMLQKAALATRDGVFVNPLVGKKKSGDFSDDVILECYEEMIHTYYPKDRCILGTLHTEMRYAGPKEAIHHAIMRQNYGCTHIIIGRDHAGVGKYYDPFAAHHIFADYEDLEIEPVFYPAMFYCKECMSFSTAKGCPHDAQSRLNVSGTALREMFQAKKTPSEYTMRPEIIKKIQGHSSPFVE